MTVLKGHLENRSSNCLRKYRMFFALGVLLLCTQIYLAYNFLALEHESQQGPGKVFSDENYSQNEEIGRRIKNTHQLKLPPDKVGSSHRTLNRNRTTRIKLDRSSLDFVPMCEVTGREAVSAITRAQSQKCKERIVNVTCLNQQNLLYPTKLQSSCPHSLGFVGTPTSLGCYKDDKISRLLPSYYAIFKSNNSPELCASVCLQSGFPFAGVEYSVECFCGKAEPQKISQLPDSSCDMKCPGNLKQSCGGYLTMNVFSTGIKSTVIDHIITLLSRNSSVKSVEEPPVRVAYLLTVNGRASRQVKRLISILYDPSHLFYIHVDARQDYMYRELLEVEKKCENKNVIVAKGTSLRHASIWGGASLLTTFLTSARQMLLHSSHWDFLVNLSESDYPIKTNVQLVEFLTANRGMNFVKSHGREVQRFLTKQGLDKTFVECEARMWRVGDRKLPRGIQIDGGSDWVALSRDFIEYVTDPHPDELVDGLLRIFRYTLLPAESFFHTVLRNSRFCDTYIDNNLHVTNWKRKLGCKCQYKAVVDWCGCSPNDFKVEDLSRIKNAAEKNLFFARKFEPIIDQRIIDAVENWLYPEMANSSNALMNIRGQDSYWQSLYHHKDSSPSVDDALLTVSDSLARLAYRRFGELDISKKAQLLEATSYFRENRFTGILVRAALHRFSMESSTLMADVPEHLEIFIQMRRNFSTSKSWLGKILSLSVNTDYDQKEQTFRNFLGSIGPLSNPVLTYEFDAAIVLPLNLSILWVDPLNRLADASFLQVDESTLMGYMKLELNEPLVAGVWHLYVVFEEKLIAKLNFLVVPLTYWQNRRISEEKSREINHNTQRIYHVNSDVARRWHNFLKPYALPEHPVNLESMQSKLVQDLEYWIDNLVTSRYNIGEVCDASSMGRRRKTSNANLKLLQRCVDTDWSSLSPDPKSDFRTLCHNRKESAR
ncbi:hypothetical protein QAD02_019965 [Eretmocerus hayati]|uniref:Uncharacterized protein n=1 Tax=Eretmocerus hayati TaxID=131215 RepID=A0ACC2PL42_9HYME|nr:hypothetical protein QAD02_019965 [Eretmocerus hayati]